MLQQAGNLVQEKVENVVTALQIQMQWSYFFHVFVMALLVKCKKILAAAFEFAMP